MRWCGGSRGEKVVLWNSFEFTNLGILKLPVEDIYRGGNSKSRNPHIQIMLRMIGFNENEEGIYKFVADKSAAKTDLSERQRQILDAMDTGAEYSTEQIAEKIGLKS